MKYIYIPPTAEEAEKIKNNDWEACKTFFLRNFEFICSAAKRCVYRLSCISKFRYNKSSCDELVNHCYLNLSKMGLQKVEFFVVSMRHQLLYMLSGGTQHDYYLDKHYGYVKSLDAPLSVSSRSGDKEDGATLGDFLSVPSAEEEFINNLEEFKGYEPERIDTLLSIIKDYLTEPQYIVTVYRLTTDMTYFSISNELNLRLSAVMSLWSGAKEKLTLEAFNILNRLAESGFKKKSLLFG